MKNFLITLILIAFCALNATNYWIHDSGNPENNVGDWRANYWVYI